MAGEDKTETNEAEARETAGLGLTADRPRCCGRSGERCSTKFTSASAL